LWSSQLVRYKRLNPQIWGKSQQKNFSGLINGYENQEVHEKQAILWLENIYIRLKLATFQHLLQEILGNLKTEKTALKTSKKAYRTNDR